KITCDMSCQTSWSAIYKKEAIPKDAFLPKPKKDDKAEQKPELPEQRTLHIEVESVSSSSALQRAPLHQRLWKVCTDLLNTIKAGVYMMGENFTYVLFVGLCLWCLYLIISHYYTFLENNMAPKK
ncbi:CG16852, partial [Drosophila busckii]